MSFRIKFQRSMQLTTARGRILYLLGNDGTGKTTQAELLLETLQEKGIRCKYVWLRFPHFLSVPVLALSRMLGFTQYEVVSGRRQGEWQFYRAPWLASILLWCQVIDAALVRAVKLEPALWRGELIVLDRYVYDIVVDIAAAARNPELLLSRQARLLYTVLPKGSAFLLDADSASISQRRPDLLSDSLHPIKGDLYRSLAVLRGIPALNALADREKLRRQISGYAGILT